MKKALFSLMIFSLGISTIVAQETEVTRGKTYTYSKTGLGEILFFPVVNIPNGDNDYTATAIQLSYGYSSPAGFYVRTQFINRISSSENLKKYHEFIYLNGGYLIGAGKRFQVPIAVSIGSYGFTNADDITTGGLRLGADTGFRFFITNKVSLRFEANAVPYFNFRETSDRLKEENSGLITRFGFGIDYSFNN